MMRRLFLLLALPIFLAACGAARDREMPNNDQDGADQMKRSPCACVELRYAPPQFHWVPV